ncbi:hypothetical protein YC2023_033434 [Brassica napus]
MDWCRIDVSEELGRYVATKRDGRSVATDRAVCMLGRRVSIELGLSAIGAVPYDGCLRTLVEGIKPFVVRLGVKKEEYELSSRNLTLCELIYPVFDTMPRDVRDQCAGFRARPRFTPGFSGCDD